MPPQGEATNDNPHMTDASKNADAFVELMTRFQPRLFAYLMSLTGNADDANDLLQETNVILWKEASKFDPETSFKAWAFRVAHFQFMTLRQKRIRDRVTFGDDLLAVLAVEASHLDETYEERRELLGKCLAKLTPNVLRVVGMRYSEGASVAEISQRLGRTANSISQLLFRARQTLTDCTKRPF